jgi:hypothetical protein
VKCIHDQHHNTPSGVTEGPFGLRPDARKVSPKQQQQRCGVWVRIVVAVALAKQFLASGLKQQRRRQGSKWLDQLA